MNERKIQPDRRGGNDKLERPKTICIARILKITNGLSEYHQNWRTGIDWNKKMKYGNKIRKDMVG